MQLEAHPVDGIRVFCDALLGILDDGPGSWSAGDEIEHGSRRPDDGEATRVRDGDAAGQDDRGGGGGGRDESDEADESDERVIEEWNDDDEPTAVYARSAFAESLEG